MKTERVYREIVYRRFERNQTSLTQRQVAASCSISLGLVNFALKPLRRMGAVEIKQRGFEILDPWKVLMYWCAVRDLERETVYSNLVDEPVYRIEANLPGDSIPTAYTAYRERFGDAPADYSEVYVYGEREEFVRRFGPARQKGRRNIFVLRNDQHLSALGKAPLAQIYADLWNIETWYARRFLEGLGQRLRKMLPARVP
ncbi:MAG: hypothetical protein HYU03_03110 [Thaumarchaeota archaeon]|nr:hypothetical protein [Nitrososphaerota archaeon]MCS4539662.1 hypothetical protein [Nitrososphaerota archaeon]